MLYFRQRVYPVAINLFSIKIDEAFLRIVQTVSLHFLFQRIKQSLDRMLCKHAQQCFHFFRFSSFFLLAKPLEISPKQADQIFRTTSTPFFINLKTVLCTTL